MKRDNFWGLVGFNQQHYNITMWIAALLSYAWQWHHADGESLNWYFDLPEDTMKGNELLTTTPIFFNCDETCGNPPNPKSAKVGEKVGVKNPMQLSSAGKLQKRGRPRHHDLGMFNLSWYMVLKCGKWYTILLCSMTLKSYLHLALKQLSPFAYFCHSITYMDQTWEANNWYESRVKLI